MTPNTYLEAVNVMLSSVGETPVNSLESQNVEAEIAADILLQESRWSKLRDGSTTVRRATV